MPHVVLKLGPGKSPAQKRRLSDAILRDVTDILGAGEASVSIGIEEVLPQDWDELVYRPDIEGRWTTLTKLPGYGPGVA